MKNYQKCSILGLFALSLCACGGTSGGSSSSGGSEPKTFDGTTYYDEVEKRVSYQSASELSFDEELDNGTLDDDLWWTIDGYWDAGGSSDWHNGVRRRNLRYYNDGTSNYLGIKARGSYCLDDDLTKSASGQVKAEGACIMSKNFLKPGRFEIDMKTMPREGAVTAMWTYYSKGSEATSQNEIDIELGGNGQYTNEWTTSWTTHTNKETDSVDVTKICHLNDGAFHKYSFDWYTDYQGSGEKRVDWFIDGILIKSISGGAIPEMAMPLWIGLWCPSWAGNSSFIYDYMLIKSISYKQFDDSTQYCEDARGNPAYSHLIPSASSIASASKSEVEDIMKLSNTSFESLDKAGIDQSYYGWLPETASKGTVALSDEHSEGSKSFLVSAGDSSLGDIHGEYLDQKLSLVYEGYQYDFSIDAKLSEGSSASIEIVYKTPSDTKISKDTISIDSSSWKSYSKKITMPEKSGILSVNLVVDDGSCYFDNCSLKNA